MTVPVRIADEQHMLSREDILAAARQEQPRKLNAYFVEIDGQRYPPKQLIRGATQSTKPFVTAVAVRALRALGFEVIVMESTR